MRIQLSEILNKIGIETTLNPYETIPMDFFNAERGTDFCAGVSMSGDGKTVEAEIQMIEHIDDEKMKFTQVFFMHAVREHPKQDMFIIELMRIRSEKISGEKTNWLNNGTKFFKMCTSHIKKGMLPDFDVLYKACFGEDQNGKGDFVSGSGGSRNFKNDKPSAPLKPFKPPGRL